MIFRIDMSNNYKQKSYTVIALVSVDSNNKKDNQLKKGIVLTDPLRNQLMKKYTDVQLHAGLISILLEDLVPFKRAIICPDIKPIEKVFGCICSLHPELVFGHLKSLSELREELGNNRYKSEADAFARRINRNFKKIKNIHRKKSFYDLVIIINSNKSLYYDCFLKKLEKLRRFIESNR